MERERFLRLDQLLQSALALDPARRGAFADQACAGDPELRAELGRLLAAELNTEALRHGVDEAAAAWMGGDAGAAELPAIPGYRVLRRIGAGGMGVVYEAYDPELGRTLAIKAIPGRTVPPSEQPPPDETQLARFLGEAQVTGQLDHPGVVPVYELGRDPQVRVYFTMRLVTGRTAHEVFALARAQRDGWSLTRALEVVLKICDTLSYAHDKGVIHRDLKPENVMVGRFGEVYVMDWGLAKVRGRKDARDLRLLPPPAGDPEGALVTADGAVLGTPSYMPPEQAQGRVEDLDARGDVYAVGACLYHLLTGRQPYVSPGTRASAEAILDRVRAGPPEPVHAIDRTIPRELVAVCDKAMARDPNARYATMSELSEDLRAYLGDRVVKVYRTGAWVELAKWVKRNRGLAAGMAAALLTTVLGAVGVGFHALRADRNARLADANAREARQNLESYLQLADGVTLHNLVAEADALWPEVPEKVDAMDGWLRRARALTGRRPHLEQALHEVAARGHPVGAAEALAAGRRHPRAVELAEKRARRAAAGQELADLCAKELEQADQDKVRTLESEARELDTAIAALAAEIEAALSPAFDATGDQFLYGALERLVSDLRALEDPRDGLVASVERRRAWASTVRQQTVVAEQAAWDRAIASIADVTECPAYQGVGLPPQLGLVPLRRDPGSGLWEFWHPRTGARPEQDADDRLVIGEATGLVFVLVPGGSFWMGSQRQDRRGHNFEQVSGGQERPVHHVQELTRFFLSKYEMTQGQWQRITGSNPSSIRAGQRKRLLPITPRNPVESVSFRDCTRVLARMGLLLPTEAQWEYSCRAGTSTPWHTGDTPGSLEGFANIADEGSRAFNAPGWSCEAFDDGHAAHAPVGSYRANAFGLHDMHGNVWEWCADPLGDYGTPPRLGDGARSGNSAGFRVYRGGSFNNPAFLVRSAHRGQDKAESQGHTVGCRPALAVTK